MEGKSCRCTGLTSLHCRRKDEKHGCCFGECDIEAHKHKDEVLYECVCVCERERGEVSSLRSVTSLHSRCHVDMERVHTHIQHVCVCVSLFFSLFLYVYHCHRFLPSSYSQMPLIHLSEAIFKLV